MCLKPNIVAPRVSSLSSLRNRQPQQSETRSVQSSSGYRNDYDQYSQYHQQQMYPGYYSSWGFDQTGYTYNNQLYDYSQYPASQVSCVCLYTSYFLFLHCSSDTVFLFRRARLFLMMDLKVCTGSELLIFLSQTFPLAANAANTTVLECMDGDGNKSWWCRAGKQWGVVMLQSPRWRWTWWKPTRSSWSTVRNCMMLWWRVTGRLQSLLQNRTIWPPACQNPFTVEMPPTAADFFLLTCNCKGSYSYCMYWVLILWMSSRHVHIY